MSSLWIPESARAGFVCRICAREYSQREQPEFERHLASCSEEHHDQLVALNAEKQRFNQHVDPEWEAYNAAIRAEGRNPEEQYARGRRSNIRRAGES